MAQQKLGWPGNRMPVGLRFTPPDPAFPYGLPHAALPLCIPKPLRQRALTRQLQLLLLRFASVCGRDTPEVPLLIHRWVRKPSKGICQQNVPSFVICMVLGSQSRAGCPQTHQKCDLLTSQMFQHGEGKSKTNWGSLEKARRSPQQVG